MAIERIGSRRVLLRVSNLLLYAAVAVLALSCGGKVYHEFAAIGGEGWARNDTLSFVYDGAFDKESLKGCNLAVEARVDASYTYKELAVRVETLDILDDTIVRTDTLRCTVYSDDGQRKGTTAGMLYQVSSEPHAVEKRAGSKAVMRLSHIMGDEQLGGVRNVGVRLSFSGRGQRLSSEK